MVWGAACLFLFEKLMLKAQAHVEQRLDQIDQQRFAGIVRHGPECVECARWCMVCRFGNVLRHSRWLCLIISDFRGGYVISAHLCTLSDQQSYQAGVDNDLLVNAVRARDVKGDGKKMRAIT